MASAPLSDDRATPNWEERRVRERGNMAGEGRPVYESMTDLLTPAPFLIVTSDL